MPADVANGTPPQGARRALAPLRDFLRTESAGGVVLVAATVAALIWANSPWKALPAVDPELPQRMAALGKYGVLGYLCAITLKKNKLTPEDVRDEP